MEINQIILNKVKNNQFTYQDLLNSFDKNVSDFSQHLDSLIDNGLIHRKKNNVLVFIENNFKLGIIKINQKGFGFIKQITQNQIDDFFVSKNELNGSITGDYVIFDIVEFQGKKSAVVKKVIERTKEFLIGTIVQNGKYTDFIPNDINFKNYLTRINKDNKFKIEPNQIVKAKILFIKDNRMYVSIEEVIGSALKATDKIISIAYENNISVGFSKEAEIEAEKRVKFYENDINEKNTRLNNSLLDVDFVTIDGDDSKDLDDAIYVKKINNGFKLIVAIADVSYFVEAGSKLDNEALLKGNSTYLANIVLPMLPEILSNGVCSLNPDVERFCLACIIEFDASGNVLSKNIIKSIMKSKARLTYKEVNNYFENGEINRPDNIKLMLDVAKELHYLIEKKKYDKGTIEFDIPEPKVILDKEGIVKDIIIRPTGISEKLIENFMVSANEAVANTVHDKNLPFIYRNHPGPDEIELLEWYKSLTLLGIDTKISDKDKSNTKNIPLALREIDKSISDVMEKSVINISLLKYMGKAFYGLENNGHFGLASNCYTHFTSPIRRYSDLIVHRLLKKYIIEKKYSNSENNNITDMIIKSSNIINQTEKQSVNAERDVNKVCSAEYMTKFINNDFSGIISYIAKFGIFVQIDNCIEGMIHVSNLAGYEFDEKTNTFINSQNKVYRIGKKLKVKLINADVVKKIIDFQIIE